MGAELKARPTGNVENRLTQSRFKLSETFKILLGCAAAVDPVWVYAGFSRFKLRPQVIISISPPWKPTWRMVQFCNSPEWLEFAFETWIADEIGA